MPTLTQSTPVLRASDYPRAKGFWMDKLGFQCVEEGGDPARFGIFKRDRAIVFVNAWVEPLPRDSSTPAKSYGWDAYIHVDDLDAIADEVKATGIAFATPPHDTVYGMREFEICDPDNNVICFGADRDE